MNPTKTISWFQTIERACWLIYLSCIFYFFLASEPLLGPFFLGGFSFILIFFFLLKKPGINNAIFGILVFLFSAIVFAKGMERIQNKFHTASGRMTITNDLKQLVLAMQQYQEEKGHLPPQTVFSPDGTPLYSWRVELLPYLEHGDLYNRFRKNEPWDSIENLKLLEKAPILFRSKGPFPPEKNYLTPYQVFFGAGAAFEGNPGLVLERDFPDGLNHSILIVNATNPVPWTKPEDIPFAPDQPLKPLGEDGMDWIFQWWIPRATKGSPSHFFAGLADGTVKIFHNPPDDKNLRAWITRNGGERVGEE